MGNERVRGHDYHSKGYYFITMTTRGRRPWLSRIEQGEVKLEPWGLSRYKPSGAVATRWLAEGRTLVLTGFPDNVPQECHRDNCLKNNEWVHQIANAFG